MNSRKKNLKSEFANLFGVRNLYASRPFLFGVSLVLAILMWFFVSWNESGEVERPVSVAVRYLDTPADLILESPVKNVQMRVAGRTNSLLGADHNAFVAEVTVGNLEPGRYRLPVKMSVPDGMRIVSYTPQTVEINLYRQMERVLPVVVRVNSAKFPKNEVRVTVVDPDNVTVSAPEDWLKSLKEVYVTLSEPPPRVGLPLTVQIDSPLPTPKNMTITPTKVRVWAELLDKELEKEVSLRVPVIGEPLQDWVLESVRVFPEKIRVKGFSSALSAMGDEIRLSSVDITGLQGKASFSLPLPELPEGVHLEGKDEVNVTVLFQKQTNTFTYLGVPLVLQGGDPNRLWRVEPLEADVTIEGDLDFIKGIDPDLPPFELYIDASNIVSARTVLPVLARIKRSGFHIQKITPDRVTLFSVSKSN